MASLRPLTYEGHDKIIRRDVSIDGAVLCWRATSPGRRMFHGVGRLVNVATQATGRQDHKWAFLTLPPPPVLPHGGAPAVNGNGETTHRPLNRHVLTSIIDGPPCCQCSSLRDTLGSPQTTLQRWAATKEGIAEAWHSWLSTEGRPRDVGSRLRRQLRQAILRKQQPGLSRKQRRRLRARIRSLEGRIDTLSPTNTPESYPAPSLQSCILQQIQHNPRLRDTHPGTFGTQKGIAWESHIESATMQAHWSQVFQAPRHERPLPTALPEAPPPWTPTTRELRDIASHLPLNRAAGPDGLAYEFYKFGGDLVPEVLQRVFAAEWASPTSHLFQESAIYMLHKDKDLPAQDLSPS